MEEDVTKAVIKALRAYLNEELPLDKDFIRELYCRDLLARNKASMLVALADRGDKDCIYQLVTYMEQFYTEEMLLTLCVFLKEYAQPARPKLATVASRIKQEISKHKPQAPIHEEPIRSSPEVHAVEEMLYPVITPLREEFSELVSEVFVEIGNLKKERMEKLHTYLTTLLPLSCKDRSRAKLPCVPKCVEELKEYLGTMWDELHVDVLHSIVKHLKNEELKKMMTHYQLTLSKEGRKSLSEYPVKTVQPDVAPDETLVSVKIDRNPDQQTLENVVSFCNFFSTLEIAYAMFRGYKCGCTVLFFSIPTECVWSLPSCLLPSNLSLLEEWKVLFLSVKGAFTVDIKERRVIDYLMQTHNKDLQTKLQRLENDFNMKQEELRVGYAASVTSDDVTLLSEIPRLASSSESMDCKEMLDRYGVSVTFDSDLREGRGLVSECGFPKGSTVTIQDPICHVVRSNWHDKLCSTCFKELKKSPVKWRCSRCHYNHYCNTDCQKRDWFLHKAECRVMASIPPPGRPSERMRFALRLVMLRKKSIEDIDHLYKHEVDQTALQGEQVMWIRRMCEGNKHVDRENLSSLESLLSRVSCNSFSIVDDGMEHVGHGIYILPSFLNHSCRPNCSYVFNGLSINIMALQDIPSGQQLYISYADLLKPKRVRQEFLSNTYHFACRCPRCIEDSELDLFLDCLLCQKCSRSALAPKAAPEGMGIDVCRCEDSSIADAGRVDSLLKKFKQLSEDSQPMDKSSLEKWLQFQAKTNAVLSPLHHLSIRVREMIRNTAINLRDWEKAYTTAKELIKFYELFLEPSPLYSVHLANLFTLCQNAKKDNSEQIQLYAKMMGSLKLTHGPAHHMYTTMQMLIYQILD